MNRVRIQFPNKYIEMNKGSFERELRIVAQCIAEHPNSNTFGWLFQDNVAWIHAAEDLTPEQQTEIMHWRENSGIEAGKRLINIHCANHSAPYGIEIIQFLHTEYYKFTAFQPDEAVLICFGNGIEIKGLSIHENMMPGRGLN